MKDILFFQPHINKYDLEEEIKLYESDDDSIDLFQNLED